MIKRFLVILVFFASGYLLSQTQVFRENNKWGIKENDKIIVQPIHDSVFNFDSTGKVCLVCEKSKGQHPNKYIKTPVFTFRCNYINRKNQRLIIRQANGDTTSVFTLLKTTVSQYRGNTNVMAVAVKDKDLSDQKNLVDKDFNQITSKGYNEVYFSSDPQFLIASRQNENHTVMEGLINLKEEEVVPIRFTHVKLNTRDSLIIACTAGLGSNSEDEIYDYSGKKITASRRHIELATKKYIVHRIFIPKEYLIIVNRETKEEQTEQADSTSYHTENEILMENDGHWFTYDINTHKKKSYDMKHKR